MRPIILTAVALLSWASASIPLKKLVLLPGQRAPVDLCEQLGDGHFEWRLYNGDRDPIVSLDSNNCAAVIHANRPGKVGIDVIDSSGNYVSRVFLAVGPKRQRNFRHAWHQAGKQTNSTFSDTKRKPLETAFIVGVAVLLVLALFSLGCKLDYTIIWKNFRRPVNLLIGMACQFVIMPLIAFGLGKATRLNWMQAMALFACGISPGGGASNLYTEMFMGDIELSAVMTFVSSLAAFGTVPLWLLFMNRFILPQGDDSTTISGEVPFAEITRSLASLAIPLLLGLLSRKFLPKFAEKVAKVVRVLAVIFLIYVVVVGFVAYKHVFHNIDWRLVVCSITLPWIGFCIGGLASALLRRRKEQAVAISLETGIQNTGIAIFLIQRLLKSDEMSDAMVSPVFYALSTPIPIMVCFGLRMIIEKVRNEKMKKHDTTLEYPTGEAGEAPVEPSRGGQAADEISKA